MSVRIVIGDCRETLATLPAGSVHCIVTSPPYYGLRDYGVGDQIGLEDTPDAYVAEMVGVFRELRRVLRDDGVAWLNLGDSFADAGQLLGVPWRVAFALQSDGWTLRDACVWHKPNPMPESVAGTRWERCRVKVRNISPGEPGWCSSFGTDNGAYHEKRAREGYGCEHRQVEWADCPGCDKCAATDGYVLRAGSWRHTSAHEMVFMLTKGMGYFCDQEAVRETLACPDEADGSRVFGGVNKSGANVRHGDRTTGRAYDNAPSGRNPRNVWSIATRPYSGAHFATMPPDLAERCIKAATSSKGVCPACGSQWAPVVERSEIGPVDHRPTCECPPADPIPATVLDPFGGAGTTALVADRLGRDAILCELNAEYAELARSRLVGDAPMLASVEVTT